MNFLSRIADLVRRERTPVVSQGDVLHQMESNAAPLILDVRTPEEFNEGHLSGAVNIPDTELCDRLSEIRSHQHKPVLVH